jgi:TonB-linked SusC/RagA family outer membrane protein
MNKPRRWLFVMKITVLQILISAFSAVMVFAVDGKGQAVLEQRISIDVEGVDFQSALILISKQAKVKFAYSPELVRDKEQVTLYAEEEPLADVLEELLGPDISYKVIGRQIVLTPFVPVQIPVPTDENGSSRPMIGVSGKVTDESGHPLPGVNILIKGTTLGTTTDFNGTYALQVEDPEAVLIFSFIGYVTQEVSVNNRTTIDIVLMEDLRSLNEVIVVGYGTQKKENLTGAVDQVGSETFENRPLPNLTQGLQGVLPNVNIRLLDGKPNAAPSINIRGTTSIGSGGSALILIDGVEGDPSMLNPNDIASISVLKDAASAAIYGARGAFGVVLITTKKPERNAFQVTYDGNFGLKQPTVLPNYLTDGYLWAKMFNESFYAWENTFPQNVNKTLTFSQEYLEELKRRSENPNLPKTEIGPDGQYVYYHNTDWYDLLYKDHQQTSQHNISVSRSTDKADFMISGRAYNQEGLFRYNSDDFKVYNLRARGSLELYRWLRVSNSFEYSSSDYHNPLNVGEGSGIWRNIADEGHVLAPMLNPDGTLTHSAAYTVGDFYLGKNGIDTKRNIIRNTTGFESRILNDKVRVFGNFTFQSIVNNEFTRRVQVPYSKAPGVIEYVGTQYNDIRNVDARTNYNATNVYGEYESTFSDAHYFKAMAGVNYEQSIYQRNLVQRNGLIFEDAEDINLALGQSILTEGGYEKWRILGGFARINYIFKDRYLLEFNGRYDGSSKFPTNEQYAFFPSISAGWRVSEESFWPVSQKVISNFKIRASYGSLGNGNIESYLFQETFSITQSGRILNGIRPQKTSRPSVLPEGLTWETATTRNFGVDLEMVSGKLQLSADAYVRKTTDMYTIGRTLPATFGATSPKGNYADLETKGWEIVLGWRDQFNLGSKSFNYRVGLNMADNQSVILKYNNPDKFLNDYYEGQKVGELWGYVTEGFFTSLEDIANHADQSEFLSTARGEYLPGDIKFKDINGDGVITPGDNTVANPGDRIIIGNRSPRYTFGVNLSADWNGFFISAFFQGVGKQDWYPRYESNVFWGQYNRPYGDVPMWHLKEGIIWTPENPNSFFPRYVSRLANRDGGILREQQTKYVMNAAYVRLKNLQIGYTFSPDMLESLKIIRGARVYISAENIWTWSPLYRTMDNVDVENATAPSDQLFTSSNAGDGYNYPMLKGFTLGISATF